MAWDLWCTVSESFKEDEGQAIARIREELSDMHNFCNTAGPVNVALLLVEDYEDRDGYVVRSDLRKHSEYSTLVNETKAALSSLMNEYESADWGNSTRHDGSDNKSFHMNALNRLMEGLAVELSHAD